MMKKWFKAPKTCKGINCDAAVSLRKGRYSKNALENVNESKRNHIKKIRNALFHLVPKRLKYIWKLKFYIYPLTK